MKKRIATVVLSMVLVATMAMAIPAKVSATVFTTILSSNSSRYGMTIQADVLSSTQTKGTLELEHICGQILALYDGFVDSIGYDSNNSLIDYNRVYYVKENVSEFIVTSIFSYPRGGIAKTRTGCEVFGTVYLVPQNI